MKTDTGWRSSSNLFIFTRVRLVALGHLLPIGAHSFHEIMSAARSFEGCTYTDGNYRYIPPLDWKTELKPLWEQAEKKVKNDIRK